MSNKHVVEPLEKHLQMWTKITKFTTTKIHGTAAITNNEQFWNMIE